MEFNLGTALLAIVVFQLFFLAFFLLTSKKGKKQSNMLLGLFFLMVGISMLDMWLSIHGMYEYYLRIAFLDDGFILALGPIILLYTRTIMYKDFSLTGSSLYHFIPFIIVTGYFIIVSVITSSEEQKQMMDDVQNFNLPLVIALVGVLFYVHSFVYLLVSSSELRKYRNQIYQEYSSTDKMNIDWLDFTIKSIGILIFLAIVHAIVPYGVSKSIAPVSALFFIGFIFYFSNRVILKGLVQPELFGGISTKSVEKYTSSNLTIEERTNYQKKLSDHITLQKPFLEPDLTINQLAEIVDLPPKTLSQVINQSYQKSFFDFINTYRVEEAKELFDNTDDEKLTIQEVMYQSGFNSKSSFNTFFKKVTELTPSEYRNKNKLVI
jgi:AraC-like DNA-binding protein